MNFDNEQPDEAVECTSDQCLDEDDTDSESGDELSLGHKGKSSAMDVHNVGEKEYTEIGIEKEQLTQDDILMFLEDESIAAARTCSQEVRSHHVPVVDMTFDNQEAAFGFYNEYASICGFSVKKAGYFCAKKEGGNAPTRITFKCNRSGKMIDEEEKEARLRKRRETRQQKTGQVPRENLIKKKTNTIDITGCKAQLIITKKNEKWVITTVNLEHNHDLSPPSETKYLRSHKHMTEEEKLLIRTFNVVKLPTRKIMTILSFLRGGNTPYTKNISSM